VTSGSSGSGPKFHRRPPSRGRRVAGGLANPGCDGAPWVGVFIAGSERQVTRGAWKRQIQPRSCSLRAACARSSPPGCHFADHWQPYRMNAHNKYELVANGSLWSFSKGPLLCSHFGAAGVWAAHLRLGWYAASRVRGARGQRHTCNSRAKSTVRSNHPDCLHRHPGYGHDTCGITYPRRTGRTENASAGRRCPA
jgi:hypothetical protein